MRAVGGADHHVPRWAARNAWVGSGVGSGLGSGTRCAWLPEVCTIRSEARQCMRHGSKGERQPAFAPLPRTYSLPVPASAVLPSGMGSPPPSTTASSASPSSVPSRCALASAAHPSRTPAPVLFVHLLLDVSRHIPLDQVLHHRHRRQLNCILLHFLHHVDGLDDRLRCARNAGATKPLKASAAIGGESWCRSDRTAGDTRGPLAPWTTTWLSRVATAR